MEINNLKQLLEMVTKSNIQRVKMSVTLANLAMHDEITLHVRVAICTTLFDIIKNDADPELDSEMIKLFNKTIDKVSKEVKEITGEDIREMMNNLIKKAEAVANARINRINDGNDILKQINLN